MDDTDRRKQHRIRSKALLAYRVSFPSIRAMRCLLLLGFEPERFMTVHEIAERMNMSYEHLVLVECFDPEHNTCPISSACRLADTVSDALNAFLAVLDEKSLADMLGPREALVPLLARRAAIGA